MAIFLDVCWRVLLVSLFGAAFYLAAGNWFQVEMTCVALPDPERSDKRTDHSGPVFTQTPNEAARGQLALAHLHPGGAGRAFQILIQERDDLPNRPGKSWLLALYGPALLAGLGLALFLPAGPGRAVVVLGCAGVALVILGLHLLRGFPLAPFVDEINARLTAEPPTAAGVRGWEVAPQLQLVWVFSPLVNVLLLLGAAGVAAVGFVLPQPDYGTAPEKQA